MKNIYMFNELTDIEKQKVRLNVAVMNYYICFNYVKVEINSKINKKIVIIKGKDKVDFCKIIETESIIIKLINLIMQNKNKILIQQLKKYKKNNILNGISLENKLFC